MTTPVHHRRGSALVLATIATACALLCSEVLTGSAQGTLPTAVADADFWALSTRLSERNGFFQSNSGSTDNLLSNENTISSVAAALSTRTKPGGVYLGVGPEQNFTYLAAMRPAMAFVMDVRRGNLQVHLVYKAAFELSADRADFVARLFTRTRPSGLTRTSSAADLMRAYLSATPGDAAALASNIKTIEEHLIAVRHLPLGADDRAGVEYVLRAYHQFGPAINYTSTINAPTRLSSYATIQATTDASGIERTFLADERAFAFVKELEAKNLIVPVVGDFAGSKALRAIGAYVREHGSTIAAFYVSNVEMYLQRNGVWPAFCANVATLPIDATSLFIRPNGRGAALSPIGAETSGCRGR